MMTIHVYPYQASLEYYIKIKVFNKHYKYYHYILVEDISLINYVEKHT